MKKSTIQRGRKSLAASGLILAVIATGNLGAEGASAAPDVATKAPATAAPVAGAWVPSSETTDECTLPSGETKMKLFSAPVNYEDNGEFRKIDTELVDSASPQFAVQNAAADYTLRIPEDGSRTPLAFETDDGWVRMQMRGIGAAAPVVTGDTATFEAVRGADSVEYTATASGVKEDVVLETAPDAQPTYTCEISASSNLRAAIQPNGQIDFVDVSDRVAMTVPVGVMVDSASTPAESYSVDYDMTKTVDGWGSRGDPVVGVA